MKTKTYITALPVCFFIFLLAREIERGHLSAVARAAVFAPQSGEGNLGGKVREILRLIRRTGAKDYRLSPVLARSVQQQITEAAWLMARPDPGSRYLFLDNSEIAEYGHAGVLKENKDVSLVIAD